MNSNSLIKVLSSVYPEYTWLPWKFTLAPKHFWSEPKNQRWFLEWAGKELKINEMSDWYKVSNKVNKLPLFIAYKKNSN